MQKIGGSEKSAWRGGLLAPQGVGRPSKTVGVPMSVCLVKALNELIANADGDPAAKELKGFLTVGR